MQLDGRRIFFFGQGIVFVFFLLEGICGGWYNDGMTGGLVGYTSWIFVNFPLFVDIVLVRWCVIGVEKGGSFSSGCIFFRIYFSYSIF